MKRIWLLIFLVPFLGVAQLQSSGQISVGDVRTEIGTSNGSLGYLRDQAGLPAGQVALSDFYGYQDTPPCGAITASPASVTIPTGGGASVLITITTTGPWWATDDQGWSTVSPGFGIGNGTIQVSAGAGSGRSGTITINCGGFTDTVSFSQ